MTTEAKVVELSQQPELGALYSRGGMYLDAPALSGGVHIGLKHLWQHQRLAAAHESARPGTCCPGHLPTAMQLPQGTSKPT